MTLLTWFGMTIISKSPGSGARRQENLLKQQDFLPPGPAALLDIQALVILNPLCGQSCGWKGDEESPDRKELKKPLTILIHEMELMVLDCTVFALPLKEETAFLPEINLEYLCSE